MHEASVGHQCPECVSEGRRTQRRPVTAFGGSQAGARGYVTSTLIVLNVLVAVAAFISDGGRTDSLFGGGWGGLLGSPTPLHEWGAMYDAWPLQNPSQGVAAGEYHRLVTSIFLHYGLLHLAMNMWYLHQLGRQLEAVFGPVRFLALYLLSGIGSSVACYYFSPNALSAGASGAIFGLVGGLVFVVRRLRGSFSSMAPTLIFLLIWTFAVPSISIAGHLGGLATGLAVGAALTYAPAANRTAVQAAAIGGVATLFVVLTAIQTAVLTSP